MQALVFQTNPDNPSDQTLKLKDIPLPDRPTEALIRVTLAGICNTDLEITKGYMGFSGVPGHEFVGVVKRCPDPYWIGKRVVGEINAGCGICDLCKAGDPRHCADRTTLGIFNRDGAFAEYLSLPLENLYEIPANVSDEAAVFTEPIAAACEIIDQIEVARQRVLIVGDGKLAQLIARVLPLFGGKCLLVGKHKAKLDLIPDSCETMLLPDFQPDRSFDIAVEASGSPEGFNLALTSLKPKGIFLLKSTYAKDLTFNPAPMVIDEITLVGSRCGRFKPALDLLRDEKIDPIPLISERFPLKMGAKAFDAAKDSEAMKILLEIS